MLKVTVAPTAEPITLQECKLHCRIDSLEEDDLVNSLISTARQLIETQAGIRLVTHELVTISLSLQKNFYNLVIL